MPITLTLPPDQERQLRDRAARAGLSVESFVQRLIEPALAAPPPAPAVPDRTPDLIEALAPIQEAFRASGMTEEELDEFLAGELAAVRRERRERRGSSS